MSTTIVTGDSVFAHPHFIVSPKISDGATHTTIAQAFTDATASGLAKVGIAIKPGTYEEDPDVPGNVHVWAYDRSNQTSTVNILGKTTFTQAGTSSFSNIRFTSNGDFLFEVIGANTGTSFFDKCSMFYSDDTMLEWTNGNKNVRFDHCLTQQSANSLKYLNKSGVGQFRIHNCQHFNIMTAGYVPSTVTGGEVNATYSSFQVMAWHFTGDSLASFAYNGCDSNAISQPFFLLEGANSVNDRIRHNRFVGGTGPVITVNGSRESDLEGNTVESTDSPTIDGTGTINYGSIEFLNSGNTVTTTTQNKGNTATGGVSFDGGTNVLDAYEEGTWTATMVAAGTQPDSITQSRMDGTYTRVGDKVEVKFIAVVSALTIGLASGQLRITGLPFTSRNDSESSLGNPTLGVVTFGGDYCSSIIPSNVDYVRFNENNTGLSTTSVQFTDIAVGTTISSTLTYWI